MDAVGWLGCDSFNQCVWSLFSSFTHLLPTRRLGIHSQGAPTIKEALFRCARRKFVGCEHLLAHVPYNLLILHPHPGTRARLSLASRAFLLRPLIPNHSLPRCSYANSTRARLFARLPPSWLSAPASPFLLRTLTFRRYGPPARYLVPSRPALSFCCPSSLRLSIHIPPFPVPTPSLRPPSLSLPRANPSPSFLLIIVMAKLRFRQATSYVPRLRRRMTRRMARAPCEPAEAARRWRVL
ncbi:hypothetical protein DFH09DRAFT_1143580 [Mycena vulgaris]|nr:hypothetical protein DFH09DRAFT_1143580 [Mycena vulgaris]